MKDEIYSALHKLNINEEDSRVQNRTTSIIAAYLKFKLLKIKMIY